ncbi:Kelch repeat-containing protein [Brevundimonas sp. UBA7664]|uniref:Kelch repeat-containing protein n=1 Tax=Brevundimonas sp. UBA7664 TaxID=1946141 RepID=UPI0025C71E1E|nr:kelch repeat-containing protein [Brevundimonas sp. UBA7664]
MSQIDRRAFLAAAGASSAVPFAVSAQEPEVAWTPRASAPWPVQEIYGVEWGGLVVIAGGLVSRPGEPLHVEDRVGLYDPATDLWDEGPKLPAPRHHPMLIAGNNGRIYAFGGYARSDAGDWTAMTDVWALDAGEWKAVAPLPERLCETVGVNHAGVLHLITGRSPIGETNAGWRDHGDVATHRVYIPGDDRWETARPCPMARNSAAGAALDGAIWVAGGRTVSGGGTGQLDRYDPIEDRWDTLAPIPRSEASGQQVGGGLAMAAAGGKLVVFGGEWFAPGAGGGVFAETWIYDPGADHWAAGPPMRTPRHGLAAAAVNGVVYAVAGGELVSGGRAGATLEALAF